MDLWTLDLGIRELGSLAEFGRLRGVWNGVLGTGWGSFITTTGIGPHRTYSACLFGIIVVAYGMDSGWYVSVMHHDTSEIQHV